MYFLLAFACAYLATLTDLWFSNYPRTPEFFFRVWQAHLLSAIYGLIAWALLAAFDAFVLPAIAASETENQAGVVAFVAFIAFLQTHPFWKAVFVGLFANGLANIKFFSIPTGAGSVPFGFQTFTQVFDPKLRDDILIAHNSAVRVCCQGMLQQWGKSDADVSSLKVKALAAVPDKLSNAAAVKVDINTATTALELTRVCVERLGASWARQSLV